MVYRNILIGNTYYNFCYSANMLTNFVQGKLKGNVDLTVRNTVLLDIWWNMLIKFS